jgi:hypothetical protein
MDRDKEQLIALNPKRAWETIKEMILQDEDLTIEELDAELRKYGVDPDESVKRLFLLAQDIVSQAGPGGRVSPHVSDVLSQLSRKCFGSESKVAAARSTGSNNTNSLQSARGANKKPKALAAVLSYHRNYKEESAKDRAIRLKNEKRLQEQAERVRQKKRALKK